ncbi:hypothetical protein N7468_006770 [Penicillium chermesinum]|uniref:Zn(2)-C6 fungal-type domain-containing protein n=1 Tax=Penicillium chermesinum TaxID=63820 RepID=A0A9W9TLI7_9EURO|nr:uncharacterized protein N7468_006770 [Penicillium chermesinum]KAJ5225545.1 hypothetical protein N7468_006770 [Penicillium chermesinum]
MLSPSAQASPDAATNGVKRKRKTYSCDACRRRKLKCDRGYPSCARCMKAGQARSCFYDVPPSLEQRPSKVAAPPNAAIPTPAYEGKSHTQIAPVRSLPSQLPTLQADQNDGTWQLLSDVVQNAPNNPQRPTVRADNEEPSGAATHDSYHRIIFRGENFKTQYYGGSNPVSLIGHVGYPRSPDNEPC